MRTPAPLRIVALSISLVAGFALGPTCTLTCRADAQPPASQPAPDAKHPGLSFGVIRMGVTDLVESRDFYVAHFGCKPTGGAVEFGYLELSTADGVTIVLTPVPDLLPAADAAAHTRINFRVADLAAARARMETAGVTFVSQAPSAVGEYATFVDPSGNRHNLKQVPDAKVPQVAVGVYNLAVAVTDMPAARAFYEDVLGFEALTEKYYPPTVPMKPRGSASFILSSTAKTNSAAEHGKTAWCGIGFFTDDIAAAMKRLAAAGAELIHDQPVDAGVVLYADFRDPFGNIHELIQVSRPDTTTAPSAKPDPGVIASAAKPADLSWIVGRWVLDQQGEELEEIWHAPLGGSLMGTFRWTRQGKAWLYELMVIEHEFDTEGRPLRTVLRLRHFGPGLRAWEPEKDGALRYPLTQLTMPESTQATTTSHKARAVFENPDRDSPRRFVYELTGDELVVRLEPADPSARRDEFRFRRAAPGPSR